MQAYAQQKLSGSSFEGAYISWMPVRFQLVQLIFVETQILLWRGFAEYMPAWEILE
jgi:hypothetical protein